MGLRFWKRIKIFPGVYINISKSGISFSFGPRGIKYTAGKQKRVTVGVSGERGFLEQEVWEKGVRIFIYVIII